MPNDGSGLSSLSAQYIKGVGPRRAGLLLRLGIETVLDALYYLPFRYEDRRDIKKISELLPLSPLKPALKKDQSALFNSVAEPPPLETISGKVIAKNLIKLRGRKGRSIFEIAVSDGSGVLRAKWFNQPFMEKRFSVGDEVLLSGAVRAGYNGRGLEMENPEWETISDGQVPGEDGPLHTGRIVPVYRATEGLSSRQLRAIIHNAIEGYLDRVEDPMPAGILERNGLPPLKEALVKCHFPDEMSGSDMDGPEMRKRLAFDELFMLELGLAIIKNGRQKAKGIAFGAKGELIHRLRKSLPFMLTPAQERALAEILRDMKSPHPMNRLLQGDVGSGKTVVALMAMLFSVESGYQAALMAPTGILAGQHYIGMRGPLEALGLKAALITGSVKETPLSHIAEGNVDVVIGTHALIEEDVRFGRLGLVIIDEQHRFGVRQRAVLRKKGANPDVLIMTATPIPRTLSMTLYGDLDSSVIGSSPPGRTPVETLLFTMDEKRGPDEKKVVYKLIAQEVNAGGQAYVVYPVIEGSEETSLKSAVLGEEALKKIFPTLRVSLIHGRMRPEEREAVMVDFKAGIIDILVSTTVIEVGVDVPNASLMVIAHAERFGLAQLHQLRGRVGRGRRRSRCVLLAYGVLSEEALRRLGVMVETSDGFRVSEEDLLIRGPGELMGVRQSGIPDLRVADIVRDSALLQSARGEAFGLIEADPGLAGQPALKAGIERFWKGKVELFKTS